VASLPVEILAPEKREELLRTTLLTALPRIELDAISLEEDVRRFAWLLRLKKGDRVLTIPIEHRDQFWPTEKELALITLFCG